MCNGILARLTVANVMTAIAMLLKLGDGPALAAMSFVPPAAIVSQATTVNVS
jgi:hypothetical protein